MGSYDDASAVSVLKTPWSKIPKMSKRRMKKVLRAIKAIAKVSK